MPRWRNSSQIKEKVTARDLIETDISNMSEPEFKTKIIRTLVGLEKNRRHQEVPYHRDIKSGQKIKIKML